VRQRAAWIRHSSDVLRQLWSTGRPGDIIANVMKAPSRSAVLAEARRMGLPGRKPGRPRGPNYGLTLKERRDPSGQRRFKAKKATGKSAMGLRADHPAVLEGRTLFPTRVFEPDQVKNLLVSGVNSSKTGKRVKKGRLAGAPIFTLTLEERKTCPRTCVTWRTCYGSNMQWAKRIKHGPKLEKMLRDELAVLDRKYRRRGFLVRLHVLGDFYSVRYVRFWRQALEDFPALNIWGYTARKPDGLIGREILEIASASWERFAVRFSGANIPKMASHVVTKVEDAKSTVCPMQIHEKPACCAECALCWQSQASITFLMH
jgi:hypothetical protein